MAVRGRSARDPCVTPTMRRLTQSGLCGRGARHEAPRGDPRTMSEWSARVGRCDALVVE